MHRLLGRCLRARYGRPHLRPSLGFRRAAGVVSIHATSSIVLRGDLPCGPYATDAWRAFVESMSRRDHPANFSRRIGAPSVEPAWTAIHTLAGGRRACRRQAMLRHATGDTHSGIIQRRRPPIGACSRRRQRHGETVVPIFIDRGAPVSLCFTARLHALTEIPVQSHSSE
jgi:hypothetical protein